MDPAPKPCPRLSSCELYPLFGLRASLKTWQIRYCDADFSVCERYRRGEIGLPVLPTLLPNGKHLPVAKNTG